MNNEFENFKNAYFTILFQTVGKAFKNNPIPSISTKNMIFRPKTKNEIIKAFKNIQWINKDDQIQYLYIQNIINEEPGSIDYPGTLCQEILNTKDGTIFTNKQILNFINDGWKYYNQLKENGKSISILKYDFSNFQQMKTSFKNLFQDTIDDKTLFEIHQNFKDHQICPAAFVEFLDLYIFIFNNKITCQKKYVLHQFTHYLQTILNVEKIKHNKKLDLKFLNLSKSDEETLKNILQNQNQIIPYINDFCQTVHQMFNDYKKIDDKINWSSAFMEYFLNTILNSDDLNNERLVKLYFQKCRSDKFPIYVVLACHYLDIQWERIRHILLKEDKYE